MKILLVDDSPVIRGYIGALLTSRGHELQTAGSMAGALEAAVRACPDAILMDFVLEPGRTGLAALTAISSLLASRGQTLPKTAIFTQGRLTAADESRARALGAAILEKPVHGREDEFFAAIDAWLAG